MEFELEGAAMGRRPGPLPQVESEQIRKYVAQVDIQVDQPTPSKPLLFTDISNDDLLSYGVPAEWLDDARGVDEDSVLELADRLLGEAAEALLELVNGDTPKIVQPIKVSADPFEHPDAQRFRGRPLAGRCQWPISYPANVSA